MAADTLVIQSHNAEAAARGWLARCLASVRAWAEMRGHAYAFHGDEALARTPDWYREKAGDRLPVVADHARLLLLHEAVESAGYRRAVWLDADTLVCDPARFDPAAAGSGAVGMEAWVAPDPKRPQRLRVWRNLHNACLVFGPGDPRLPFLIHAVETVIDAADPARIAPQMVGPKLLKALQPFAGFTPLPEAGAASPDVLADLAAGAGPALDRLRAESPIAPAALNLCLSLAAEVGDHRLEAATMRLEEWKGIRS